MMFKAVIFATVLALAACQQAVQQFNPYNNEPGSFLYPQGQQYNYQYQGPSYPFNGFNFNSLFKQYPYITLVNNQNQPLGYIYYVNSEVVLQQQQNFLPVRDSYGNLLGYYALSQYKAGQQFQPQILNENIISQLGQFGFVYNQPNQDKFGFLVVKNPYVFYYNENGVLKPNAIQYSRFQFRFPYNFNGPKYEGQYQYPQQYYYGQQYQGPYVPQYQGQYSPRYQGQYAPRYQGQYAPRYQGQYSPRYQGQYNPIYQGQYNPIYQFPYNYNQYVPTY